MISLDKSWIELLKKDVKGVTFVSKMRDAENKLFVRVKIKNDFGGKDTIDYRITREPMRSNEWEYIINNLKQRIYEEERGDENEATS